MKTIADLDNESLFTIIIVNLTNPSPLSGNGTRLVMNQPNLLQPKPMERIRSLKTRPVNPRRTSPSPETGSYWERLRCQLGGAWKRFQARQIRRAIAQYDPEKHFLGGGFQAVVGQATMRMVHGEIERNRLPFYADKSKPWLQREEKSVSPFVAVAPAGPYASGAALAELPPATNGLPASLREPVQSTAVPAIPLEGPAVPSKSVDEGVVFDFLAQSS